jgi:hypothetical protein
MTIETANEKWPARKAEWLRKIRALVNQIERWSGDEGWAVQRDQKFIHESAVGDYHAPSLRIRTPQGEVFLSPIALRVVGADGRVDMESWPNLNRVKLILRRGRWQVVTDSNVALRETWSRKLFRRLVHELLA